MTWRRSIFGLSRQTSDQVDIDIPNAGRAQQRYIALNHAGIVVQAWPREFRLD